MSSTAADSRPPAPARNLFLQFLALSTLLHAGLLVWAAQRMPIVPGGKTFVLQANLIDAPATSVAAALPETQVPAEAQPTPAPKAAKSAPKPKRARQARAQPKPRAAGVKPLEQAPAALPEAAPEVATAPAPAALEPQPIQAQPAVQTAADTTAPAEQAAPPPSEVVRAPEPAPTPVARSAPVIIARSDSPPANASALPELRYPDRPAIPRSEGASAPASVARNQSGAALSAPPSKESAAESENHPAPPPPPGATPAPPPQAETQAAPPREVPVIVARSAESQRAPDVLQPIAPESRNNEPVTAETRPAEEAGKESVALAQPSAAAPASALPALKELLNSLPSSVEIDYDLSRGEGGFRLGTMKLRFAREGERYSVTTQAKAAGILSLVVSGGHNMETHGVISADGLQPQSFVEQREYKGKRVDRVQFDHEADTVTFSSDRADQTHRTQPMKANTRDLLSFLFQFTVEPPTEGVIDSTLTTGRKQESFQYEIAGNETIKIGGVEMETLRLTPRDAQGKRSIEVWLSPASHYLPVKIRVKDKGNVIEQVATNIRVE